MLRKRLVLKTFAVFFLLEMLLNTVAPAITYALTSGPTAPEATSFEPIDTTDLVNTITGDFVYSVPLMEVPGPGGSYPLALGYHAGVQANTDASWVGLGWSLNPGSINRLSNGLPDDYNQAKSMNRLFWEGGEMTVNTYGVSIGIGAVATVSAGLSFANDTYRGRGVGASLGLTLGYKIGSGGSVGIDGTVGISPYGDTYASAGLSLGVGQSTGAVKSSANLGIGINSSGKVSASLSGGVSAGSFHSGASMNMNSSGKVSTSASAGVGLGPLQASISTDNPKGVVTASGFSQSFSNSKAGQITTNEDHMAVDIPVWYGVNIHLARDYYRYYMDEKETYEDFGSLYFPSGPKSDMQLKMFDTYHVQSLSSLSSGENAAKSLEGSFADYDSYSVNAQGLGGSFRPYHYTLSLYSQDIVKKDDNTKEVLGYYIPQHSNGVKYRFENDFTNRVINNPTDIEINKVYTTNSYPPNGIQSYQDWVNYSNGAYSTSETVPLYYNYSNPTTGSGTAGESTRYVPNVPGSKHIEYFTNQQILAAATNQLARTKLVDGGFIECNAAGFTRIAGDSVGTVGAFSITNESGVTYHFSLPAYSYDEYTYSQNKDVKQKISFNLLEQKGRYAYTWFLTGITGPDYVDRSADGTPDLILNEYDFGYWVDFEYGKWTDKYLWRNPAEGYNDDFDIRQQAFSKGTKEVYYLNAIKTKTHTALFVKEIRADGKSVTEENEGAVITDFVHNVEWVDGGGMNIKERAAKIDAGVFGIQKQIGTYYDFPVSSLKLNSIYLFDNTALNVSNPNTIASISNKYNHSYNYSFPYDYSYAGGTIEHRTYSVTVDVHKGRNIIDFADIAASSIPVAKALRKIDFNYSYDLAPETANSFDPSGNMYECTSCANFTPDLTVSNTKEGKLTLNSVVFKGKNGVQTLPSMKFFYDYINEPFKNSTISDIQPSYKDNVLTIQTGQQSDDFQVGDIVVFNQGAQKYYGYVTESTSSIKVACISATMPTLGAITALKRTKNPPYNKEYSDMWGSYKVDKASKGGFGQYTTPISAKNVDVWSMRSVRTSLGSTINVNYESDTYSESVYTKNLMLPLDVTTDRSDVTPISESSEYAHHAKYFFRINVPATSGFDFTQLYQVGELLDMAAAFTGCASGSASCNSNMNYNIVTGGAIQEVSANSIRVRVYVPFQENVSFKGGVMQMKYRNQMYGGGLRVKSLQMVNAINNTTSSTEYTYDFNNKSTGVTSYEPIAMRNMQLPTDGSVSMQNSYMYQIYQGFYEILSLSRDIPAPGVYYGKVKIGEKVIRPSGEVEIPGYSVFEFETFKRDMIGWHISQSNSQYSSGSYQGQPYNSIVALKKALKNFTLRMGSLKSITLYDKNGNKLNETINHYLHDEQTGSTFDKNKDEYPLLMDRYRSQGVLHETFNHARWVKKGGQGQMQGLISKKEVYPVVQTGSTTINYKTGIVSRKQNLEFDFYTGAVTRTVTSDGMNNFFVAESMPAYRFYPSMGFKSDDIKFKNMLSQNALSFLYRVDPANFETRLGLVSASAQTWSDQIPSVYPGTTTTALQAGIWRMASSFTYIGDPTTPVSGDGLLPITNNALPTFNAWSYGATVPTGWQKNSEIKRYDIYSHALEATDINGDYACTKMSQNQESVFATVANSTYDECAFSGAEDVPSASGLYGGNVGKATGVLRTRTSSTDKVTTHTGFKSLGVTSTSQKAFVYSFTAKKDRDYLASVWVNGTAGRLFYSLDGVTTTAPGVTDANMKAGSWYLITVKIPKSTTADRAVQVWCATAGASCNFDDFRVHPYDAAMISYVYNEWGELAYLLNNNNVYTEYTYDEGGRLKQVNQETIQYGVVKTTDATIHYGIND
jgi:hypothetical protein